MPICSQTRIAYDRAGPSGALPLVLVHAGIADRRMWDSIWPTLTAGHDVVRVDLRGYGESTACPAGVWSPREDVLSTLQAIGIARAHFIACSFGAGVAVEVAMERPSAVASLVLAAPGGSLLTERTDELEAFFAAERAALELGDLDAAAEANIVHWVDGPHRGPGVVSTAVRDAVRSMQRRAFEITRDWDDAVWEAEAVLDPEPPERFGDIVVPTLVLSGRLDIDSVQLAANNLLRDVPNVGDVVWPDVAHLPSMERPDDFAELVNDWVTRDKARA